MRRRAAADNGVPRGSIARNTAPEIATIDKSGANRAALEALNSNRKIPIQIRQNKYLNNVVEQNRCAIKR